MIIYAAQQFVKFKYIGSHGRSIGTQLWEPTYTTLQSLYRLIDVAEPPSLFHVLQETLLVKTPASNML